LTLGKTIVDATSGNTGIALSMIGAELGFPVKLFLPADTGLERKSIMRSFGAKLVETDPLSGPDGAYLAARQSVAADPERYFYPDQFNNHANAFAHFVGTGREIWEQTGGQVTHFLASAGTSGTFTGASKRLKSENPAIRTLLVQPATPIHGIEGTKHLETSIKPGILDESLVDGSISVTTQEAYETTRKLARRSGLYVGVSSGANVAAAMKLARQSPPGSVIVTILSDSGARYLSYPLWQV
jgi:cysteine synthase B